MVSLLGVGLLAAGVSRGQAPSAKERLLRGRLDGAPYRLFVPGGSRDGKAYPLVLFLHGGAGRGRDNERQLRDGNGMIVETFVGAEKGFPAFVLAPQTESTHGVGPTLAVLDHVRAQHRIDGRRIYGVGQSLGGYGLLDLVAARPQLFAAAVVIAAAGDPDRARALASVPTWFFHGEKDEAVPVDEVRRLVAAGRNAGGTVRYTEYAGEGHGLAWLVVRETALVSWLFSQRRPSADPGP